MSIVVESRIRRRLWIVIQREIVIDEYNGLLVENYNAKNLAAALTV
jgi:hypothetical protein